ncbi:MAG: outer membrane lipoprotein carrier protein LolA [Vicingus serpentipes]|nr:outer membrane lipoprotein carrier protein LolA [Vicingus serpentipes]
MKTFISVLLTSIIGLNSFAQDQQAKAILDKLSAKTKAYTTIKAEFQYNINNKEEGINETQLGKIEIKGDNYLLSIKGQDVISNNKSIWTILKDAEEVQINNLPDEEDDEYISPNKIFTLYEKGFKYKFVKEENGIQIINLYPIEADKKSFHRIALYISKEKTQITQVKVYGKDGGTFTYVVKSFTPNQGIPDSQFTFDKTKYPKYEIIDLRE